MKEIIISEQRKLDLLREVIWMLNFNNGRELSKKTGITFDDLVYFAKTGKISDDNLLVLDVFGTVL